VRRDPPSRGPACLAAAIRDRMIAARPARAWTIEASVAN